MLLCIFLVQIAALSAQRPGCSTQFGKSDPLYQAAEAFCEAIATEADCKKQVGSSAKCQWTPADFVTVDLPGLGRLRGITAQDHSSAFLGVRYAEPGTRRWMPPEPKRPWNGTIDALSVGSACPSHKQNDNSKIRPA